MNIRVLCVLAMTVAALGLCGCASYTADVEPDAKVASYSRYWVKTNLDDNHAIDRLLVRVLMAHGFVAEAGPLTMMPRNTQAIVTYRDRWAWDFKDHMTSLEVTIQDAGSEKQIGYARFVGPASMTTSPLEVVERLVRDLQKAKPRVIETPL
jgi:hypothetical protein